MNAKMMESFFFKKALKGYRTHLTVLSSCLLLAGLVNIRHFTFFGVMVSY